MYFYIYDIYLNDKKYERILARIESRLTDLGISGKIARLSVLKNIKGAVREAISAWGGFSEGEDKRAKTIVVVGNDQTITQVINVISEYDNITLGFIPVGPDNELAEILGIPLDEIACDILSNRLIDILDLGKINDRYFLTSVEIKDSGVVLDCDGQYKIRLKKKQQVNICNFGHFLNKRVNPKDGILETMVSQRDNKFSIFKKTNYSPDSLFFNKEVRIGVEQDEGTNEALVTVDSSQVIKTPATITIAPKKLKLIVGKERRF